MHKLIADQKFFQGLASKFPKQTKISKVDEDFYLILSFSPLPFLSVSGSWADLFHSKLQQGVWEAMKTQIFLRALKPPNMDSCQELLGAEQENRHSGGLARHPIIIWGGLVTVISATLKCPICCRNTLILLILKESERGRAKEIFLSYCVSNDSLSDVSKDSIYDSLGREKLKSTLVC